jgi:circadian clock protein KaiB
VSAETRYALRLYIAGATANSMRVVADVKDVLERHLAGRYALEVVDIYQQPALANEAGVLGAPVLVCSAPLPERRLVGAQLADRQRIAAGLGLEETT